MAIFEGIDADEPGFDARDSLASMHIEPVVYARGDELTLAIELVNRTDAELGVDFELLQLGRITESTWHAIANVGEAGPDTAMFMRSGIIVPKTALLRTARARFALGSTVLRIPARGRAVVHTEPFARTSLDVAAAKAKRAIGMYLALCVVVVSARAARILAKDPLVCLPKAWDQRPRPKDAFVLAPALLLDRAGVEREAALARSGNFDVDALVRERVEPTVESLGVGEFLQQLRARRSSFQTEYIDGLELTGFAHDDDRLQPIHVRALDELTRLFDRVPFELEGVTIRIEGHADGGCTRDSKLVTESLALRRAESVRSCLASLPQQVELRVRGSVTGAPRRSVSVRLSAGGEPPSRRTKLSPMFCYPWPGVPNSYSLAAEFPILARAWQLDTLTLPRLRAIHKESLALAAALVPERVHGKPRSARSQHAWLDKNRRELEQNRSRTDAPIPSPSQMESLVEPFGLYMTRLVALLVLVREYTLTPEELGEWNPEWVVRVLTVLVDEWQPESQRGWAARLERLRAISNETELVPALVIAIAEQCATLDILITAKQQLARGEKRYEPWIDEARPVGLEQLVSEDALAIWLAKQQEFRAAVERSDLPDLLAEYDDRLERFVTLVRAELG